MIANGNGVERLQMENAPFWGGVGVFYLDTNLVVWFFVSRERALIRETLAYYISVAHLS